MDGSEEIANPCNQSRLRVYHLAHDTQRTRRFERESLSNGNPFHLPFEIRPISPIAFLVVLLISTTSCLPRRSLVPTDVILWHDRDTQIVPRREIPRVDRYLTTWIAATYYPIYQPLSEIKPPTKSLDVISPAISFIYDSCSR